ncbi:MAG: Type II secretion system protein G [Pseudomonadales bacterium]|nr:Type II secretion system protein G [Pseudomonadales bacterium]
MHIPFCRDRGFTLIEIMVVVVIISVLIGLLAPNIMGRVDEARVTAARADLATLGQALDLYRIDNGSYPSTAQGLQALVEKPSGAPEPRHWNPAGYLKKKQLPRDPWGNEYQFLRYPDGGFDLMSYGADGREGGEGNDADIFHKDL